MATNIGSTGKQIKGLSALSPVVVSLTGKLNTYVDGTQLGEGDFQSLVNMRYTNAGIQSVMGMTALNSTALTYPDIRTAFFFNKGNPAETWILVQGWTVAGTASAVYRAYTTIPGAITSFDKLADDNNAKGSGNGYFSNAPDGAVAYCNGIANFIWGGNESRIYTFLKYETSGAYSDYTSVVNNTLSDTSNTFVVGTSPITLYIGSPRPLSGFKAYVLSANTSASTSTVSQYNGNGPNFTDAASWTALTVTDGTAVSGATLGQTGSLTWPTVLGARAAIINNTQLYWYRWFFSGALSTTSIYYITLNYPFQVINDLWDGNFRVTSKCFLLTPTYINYIDKTIEISQKDYVDTVTYTYMDLSSMATTWYFYLGFYERTCGIDITIPVGNGNASVLKVEYWNGTSWVQVSGFSDGTINSGCTLAQSSTISWAPVGEGIEQVTSISTTAISDKLYYYRFSVSATLSTKVQIDYIVGIPSPKSVHAYAFPVYAQRRLFLCNNKSGQPNEVLVSALNANVVFNGSDSTRLYVGDTTPITAAAPIYQRTTNYVYENVIFAKANSTWLLNGTSTSDWQLYQISDSIGCNATNSMKVCDVGMDVNGLPKQLVIWQSAVGWVMCDGWNVVPISDDIKNLFDKNSTDTLNTAVIDKTAAFYDPFYREVHFLCSTGASTTKNREFVYSIPKKKFFEINRTTTEYIQTGITVTDSVGNSYSYGCSYDGFIYRLEYGNTFDGYNIVSSFRTGDMPLGGWGRVSFLRKLKLIARAKNNTTNKVMVNCYTDANNNPTALGSLSLASTTQRVVFPKLSVGLGKHTFYSISCSLTTNNEVWGFEPIGLHLYLERGEEDI